METQSTKHTQSERFKGMSVVITGASRGIGAGIARRFAAEGASLFVSANEDAVMQVAADLNESGHTATGVVCDVTEATAVDALFERAYSETGAIDVSINNAGVITIAELENLSEADWDLVMDVNTKGVFLCCKAAARHMKSQGKGRIINTASGQAREGFIYTPHYAASKMGVVGITQSLAKELAKSGITVNAICPGIIETDMWAYNDREWGRLLGDYAPGELMAEWVRDIPAGRAGTPEDVAGLVAFLASDDASYITGQTINVDGGLIMS